LLTITLIAPEHYFPARRPKSHCNYFVLSVGSEAANTGKSPPAVKQK